MVNKLKDSLSNREQYILSKQLMLFWSFKKKALEIGRKKSVRLPKILKPLSTGEFESFYKISKKNGSLYKNRALWEHS